MINLFFLILQLGRLKGPFTLPEEIEAREIKIREYFLKEIDRLVTEKHICHIRNLAIAANVSKVFLFIVTL